MFSFLFVKGKRAVVCCTVALLSLFLMNTHTFAQTSSSLKLDGDLDYATASDSPSLSVSGQKFTLETWIRHDGNSAADAVIIDKTQGTSTSGGYELGLVGSGEEVPVYIDLPGTYNRLESNTGVPADRWTHIAVTYDGNQLSLYINGELDAQTSAGGDIGANSLPLKFGTNTSASNEKFFSGQIDEVRIWNKVRTLLEIKNKQFLPLKGSETGLVAYYPFSNFEPTADQAGDNDLTFSGDATASAFNVFPVPPDVYIENENTDRVKIRWVERPGINGSNNANGFTVYHAALTSFGKDQAVASVDNGPASQDTYTYVDSSLSAGKSKFYTVASVDSLIDIGYEGNQSNYVVGTPYTGNEPLTVSMKGGASLYLDGELDYGTVSDRPSLDVGGQKFTIEAWVKHDGESAENAIIADKTKGTSTSGGYELGLSGSGVEMPFYIDLPGTYNKVVSNSGVPAHRWTHIAATYDGNQISLYINGKLDAQTGAGGNMEVNNLPLKIGTNTSASNKMFFSGRIDELAIWDVARTQSQIQNTYRSELIGNEDGLRAYWRFNDAGKGVLHDITTGGTRRHSSMKLEGDAVVQGHGVFPLPPLTYAKADSDSVKVTWEARTKVGTSTEYSVYKSENILGFNRSQLVKVGASPGFITTIA